jgi:hypothetical protein
MTIVIKEEKSELHSKQKKKIDKRIHKHDAHHNQFYWFLFKNTYGKRINDSGLSNSTMLSICRIFKLYVIQNPITDWATLRDSMVKSLNCVHLGLHNVKFVELI